MKEKKKMDSVKQAWYEKLYNGFADYDDEPYVQHTVAEVDFVEAMIGEARDVPILDVGCGTGRHALELARRGYSRITGVDLSPSMLAQARAKAEAAGLVVSFLQRDARRLQFEREFEVVLILCEGAFSLMEIDSMDRQILRAAARALRPGGKLLMTAPQAAFMLARIEQHEGFDPVSLRERFTLEKNGEHLECTQRYYTFPELRWLLEAEGFQEVLPFAVSEGQYRQDLAPDPGDYEFGVRAVKGN